MAVGMIDTVALFGPERAALLRLLESLDDSDWWSRTACGDWTVHDIAIHLIGADVNVLSGDRDQFHGPPGAGQSADLSNWTNLVQYIDQRNDDWVRATRRISPHLVCELLRFTGGLLNSVWSGFDLEVIGRPVDWAGPEPAPVWMHVAREYTERWTHQQHIRDAVGRPGFTERQWMHPVLDALARALPVALRKVDLPVGSGVGLLISGESGGEWWEIADASGRYLDGRRPSSVWASVAIDQETAWRLVTRGVQPADARSSALVSGDDRAVEAVLSMVSMIVG